MLVYRFLLLLLFAPLFTIGQKLTTSTLFEKDTIPIDFSYAGYEAGSTTLPSVLAVLKVQPSGGDDTRLLQAAINHIAGLPIKKNGFRGALQLTDGTFKVSGQLNITNSGIVIRGSKQTNLIATGQDRRALIMIKRIQARSTYSPISISNDVPAGSNMITLESLGVLKPGDRVVIERPSTQEWINALGMDTAKGAFADMRIHWKPGSRNLYWDRVITAINRTTKQITIDAPITTAIEKKFGGGIVSLVTAGFPIRNVGIEQLTIISEYDKLNPFDEEHSWIAIQVDDAENVFVRKVTAMHFAGSAVRVGPAGRMVTIENCSNKKPVSELGGYRRQSFLIEGQQVLLANCYSEEGLNDFAVGHCAAGPNVIINCTSKNSKDASGSFESWSSGILYENVKIDGAALRVTYDMNRAQGGGWTAANAYLMNCSATALEAKGPAGAHNKIIHSKASLFHQQSAKRNVHNTAKKTSIASLPATAKYFTVKDIPVTTVEAAPAPQTMQIINGRFVIDGKVLWGGAVNDSWWMGQVSADAALDAGISITRFVPGREGPGHTENLTELAKRIQQQKTPFYQSGPGLWYDRRRDDHTVVKREDANVWAPFYEMPWARSGQGTSWEGLSKFDLDKYNPWYFNRTKTFASLAEQHSFVLFHSLYNTHNLLEIGAHWADYPWRPANNINETGLPEPPPMEPNNRLHLANQFYNTDHANQKRLHQQFINKVLDELGHFRNIIFNVGFQFAGPVGFQQFFIETVKEWKKKNQQVVNLSLSTSKGITDTILSNPEYENLVAVIDMRYWQYRPDGKLFAPAGGRNLAFREMIGREFGRATDAAPATTPYQAYRQVREYKDKYPDKAIVAWHNGVGPIPALMAGAAQVLMQNPTAGHGQGRSVDRNKFDDFVNQYLSRTLQIMKPKDGILNDGEANWYMSDDNHNNILIYSTSGPDIHIMQSPSEKKYKALWYNPRKGETITVDEILDLKTGSKIKKQSSEDWLLLLIAG